MPHEIVSTEINEAIIDSKTFIKPKKLEKSTKK